MRRAVYRTAPPGGQTASRLAGSDSGPVIDGKTAEDVEKEMKVSAATVKRCTAAPAKSGGKKAPAKNPS